MMDEQVWDRLLVYRDVWSILPAHRVLYKLLSFHQMEEAEPVAWGLEAEKAILKWIAVVNKTLANGVCASFPPSCHSHVAQGSRCGLANHGGIHKARGPSQRNYRPMSDERM